MKTPHSRRPPRKLAMAEINHIWFDFTDTMAKPDEARHAALRYQTFARLKKTEDTPELRREYDELFLRHASHSNVFSQEFNLDGSFWPAQIAEEAANGMYSLMDETIPKVLVAISKIVPISVFSNIDTEPIMKSLGIDTGIFANIFSSSKLRHPKPHPEGYRKIVELSGIPATKVLYIGDDERKDIIPAKSVGLQTGIIWGASEEADYNFKDFEDVLETAKKEASDE